MRIDRNQTLAGHSIVAIRDFFRKHHSFSRPEVEQKFDLKADEAAVVISQLRDEGYIAPAPRRMGVWELTIKGNALTMASAAKPIRRKTAERILSELIERVRYVNVEDYFLCKVKSVEIFGSYLSDSLTLGDIDVVINIERKDMDPEKYEKKLKRNVCIAEAMGVRFEDSTEELVWPSQEVEIFLKQTSRYISVHHQHELQAMGAKSRVIYSIDDEASA